MFEGITVNGVPLAQIIRAKASIETRTELQRETVAMKTLVTRSRSYSTRRFRNISGTRSSRGRVIFSTPIQVGGAA